MAWLSTYRKRTQVTGSHLVVDGDLANFPALVYLSASSGRDSQDLSRVFDELGSDANRKKIALTTSDGVTQCYVEIEKWDDANEKAWLWVKVPAYLAAVDVQLFLYYDALHADNDDYVGDVGSTPGELVWDANFVLVDHMQDNPDNASTMDSTDNDNDGTKKDANEPIETTGKVGDAQDFDGANDYIDLGADASLSPTGGLTYEAVIYVNDTYNMANHVAVIAEGRGDQWLFVRTNGTLEMFCYDTSANTFVAQKAGVPAQGWAHVAGTFTDNGDGTGTARAYINGDTPGTDSDTFDGTLNHDDPPDIGQRLWLGGENFFKGTIDEARISSSPRSAAWLAATYETCWDNMFTFGEEEDITHLVFVGDEGVQIRKGSLSIDLRIEERGTAEFTIVDIPGTESYVQGQPVEIYDPDATLLFGGVIAKPTARAMAPAGGLWHPTRCVDYHYFADKRLVAESYEDKTCGFIVDDIFDKYLDEEGVTIGNIELGATLIEAKFNYIKVTDCYDALAEKAGMIWWIDESKALYFQSRETTAAPWTATRADISGCWLEGDNPLYRNRQYIRGSRGTTLEQTEVLIADGDQVAFTVGYPFERVPTVTVEDLGAQTIGIKGLDAPGDFDCYWSKGDAILTLTAAPAAGKEVTVVYYGQFPILVLAEDPAEIVARAVVEGAGTGYVDNIADEPTLDDSGAAVDSAEAKLTKYAVAGKRFHFQTARSGLFPGQLLPVEHSPLSLDEDMLIESVQIRMVTGHTTYDVTAIRGPEMGSWSRLFQEMASQKQQIYDRLNVGTEQLLIILVAETDTWEWGEAITVTPATCPFPAADLYPEADLYPC